MSIMSRHDRPREESRRLWIGLRHLLAAALVLAALAGASGAALAGPCRPFVPAPQPSQPPNLGVLKLQLLEYKCLGGYDRDIAKVTAEARAYVEQRAAEVSMPALVLDIDETSLSNWTELEANDFGFILLGKCTLQPAFPCGNNDWVLNHTADAIGPTRDLFNAAKAKGLAVFFITGRFEPQRAATMSNLSLVGYQGWSGLALRPDGDAKMRSVREYKTAERAKIAAQGYTIIANVGDQYSDLDGGFAERTFKMPNPFYFIP
jgi:acid phosphatase